MCARVNWELQFLIAINSATIENVVSAQKLAMTSFKRYNDEQQHKIIFIINYNIRDLLIAFI